MNEEQKKEIFNEINSILKSRGQFINENYLKIRFQYQNPYNFPDFDPIRHEICMDILFGLYQSAITLTNHLMETFLKLSLIYKEFLDEHENKNEKESKIDVDNLPSMLANELRPFNDKYNGKDLSFTINRACKIGLISKEEKKQLHEFRERFRNPYGHADRKKQHGESSTGVQGATIEGDELKFGVENEMKLFEMLFFQGIAQWHHAEAYSLPYFSYLDQIIRRTLLKIFPDINKHPLDEEI